MQHPFAFVALALVLAACGASAPGPAPSDAGADGAPDAACPPQTYPIGGECVPAMQGRCGSPPRACPVGQICAVVSGGANTTPFVRCEPL